MNEWLTVSVASLLVISLVIYVVFGGADFGGGILEATLPSGLRSKLQSTLAPVWEANHVWLIAVVVLLFVGFPTFYAGLLTRLYLPVSFALLAVLLRGVFFTLRKYDPDPRNWSTTYAILFRVSSFAAPMFYGLILGGLLTVHPGSIDSAPADSSFAEIYLQPWLHPFGVLCGAFVSALFAYLAAVYFFGEVSADDERRFLRKRALQLFAVTFVLGGMVLLGGALSGRVSFSQALHPVFLACQAVALIAVFAVAYALHEHRPWLGRLAAGAQVLAILSGWFATQYPNLMRTEEASLSVWDAAAPPITLFWLTVGYLIVLALVAPLLVVLFRVFQKT